MNSCEACKEIREIYAGREGYVCETPLEIYQERLIKLMYAEAAKSYKAGDKAIVQAKLNMLRTLKDKIYGLPSIEGESAGLTIEFISAIELSRLIDATTKALEAQK